MQRNTKVLVLLRAKTLSIHAATAHKQMVRWQHCGSSKAAIMWQEYAANDYKLYSLSMQDLGLHTPEGDAFG